MKLEQVFSIDGNVVNKVFSKGNIDIFECDGCIVHDKIIYFVDKQSKKILFKQTIDDECESLFEEVE